MVLAHLIKAVVLSDGTTVSPLLASTPPHSPDALEVGRGAAPERGQCDSIPLDALEFI